MPLTSTGEKVLDTMQKEYGSEKTKSVSYAAKTGTGRWHRKKPRKSGPARMTYRSKV